jgi:hypothetical protein
MVDVDRYVHVQATEDSEPGVLLSHGVTVSRLLGEPARPVFRSL